MRFIFLFRFLIFSLFLNTSVYGETSIAFINMDIIMNKSKAGISITNQLNLIKNNEIESFKKKANELDTKEKKLISQKNVLSSEEFEKKILSLRNEIKVYNDFRNKAVKNANKKMLKAKSDLLNKLTPILTNYSIEKKINIILPKKNVIIGRSELDITDEILMLIDKEIKSIKIN